MKIVICSLNSQYIHSSLAPWCLLAGIHQYAPELNAVVVESTVNLQVSQTVEAIAKHEPDCIGFCCYIWNIKTVEAVIEQIKTLYPKTVIILGGPEVGFRPADVLKNPLVDYVITGEGEESFARLCSAIDSHLDTQIPGISFRKDQTVVSFPEAKAESDPPSPYCQEYFDSLNGRIAYLESSRGCPFSCAYCLSGRCGALRSYPVERTKKELLNLANSGTKTVKFVDRTFNADRKRAKDILRFIIENHGKTIPKDVCFHFEIAGDLLDEETLVLLSTAPVGAIQLEIGLQSFHEETLTYIRRKTNTAHLTENIRRLLSPQNIHVHIDLIAGLPLEDFETFGKSVDSAYALQPHMLQFGFLKLLHGAPMREDTERYPCKYNSEPPYEVTETPVLSSKELARLHKAEWALDKLYNSGRFRSSLPYVLSAADMRPFSFFLQFGEEVVLPNGASLDLLTESFFLYCSHLHGVDKTELRNHVVCDYLQTVRGGKLPKCLQIPDPVLKTARAEHRKCFPEIHQKQIGSALLYHPTRLVVAEYCEKNPVTNTYPLWEYPIEKLHFC